VPLYRQTQSSQQSNGVCVLSQPAVRPPPLHSPLHFSVPAAGIHEQAYQHCPLQTPP
jgi:hypothetical protein